MSARDDRYEEATAADAEEYLLSEHEPVEVSVSSTLLTAFAFRLEPDDVRRLRERARAQGVKPTQLVRAWVLERLTTEDKVPLEADEALSTLRRLVAHRVRAGRGRYGRRSPSPRGSRPIWDRRGPHHRGVPRGRSGHRPAGDRRLGQASQRPPRQTHSGRAGAVRPGLRRSDPSGAPGRCATALGGGCSPPGRSAPRSARSVPPNRHRAAQHHRRPTRG